jgi:cytochrome c oxidase subunit 2
MPVFAPDSPQAQAITSLFIGVLVMSAVILLIVAGLLTFIIIRYRWRPGTQAEPKQVHGHLPLEIAWTAGPLVVLVFVFVFGVVVMHRSMPAESAPGPLPDLAIIAHQWWWEVRYPASGVVTANEIHIPAGRRLLALVESADVIHDFWVPRLGPKIDAIPGHPNRVWVEADTPGVYHGTCAEYCGLEHAWMRITVFAQPEAAFDRWLKVQQALPAPPGGGEAALGQAVFRAETCVNCHRVAGTDASGTVGPDLTHVAGRTTLGAGVLENTPANLSRWLANPQVVKPGALMPDLKLTTSDVRALTAYLETLK